MKFHATGQVKSRRDYMRGSAGTDYEGMSNEELYRLLEQRLPELQFDEVSAFNRETVIAYLKITEECY
jgi:hypothetical protein